MRSAGAKTNCIMGHAVVMPEYIALREEVLQMCYDDSHAGHYRCERTLNLVSRKYWWNWERNIRRCSFMREAVRDLPTNKSQEALSLWIITTAPPFHSKVEAHQHGFYYWNTPWGCITTVYDIRLSLRSIHWCFGTYRWAKHLLPHYCPTKRKISELR